MSANDEPKARPEPLAAGTAQGEAQGEAAQQAEQAAAADRPERSRRGGSGGTWFAVLLALVAAGIAAGAWVDLRQRADATAETFAQRIQALEAQQGKLRALAQEAQQSAQALQGKLSTLEVRVADAQAQRAAIDALYQELSRNRNEWRVAEVEQMIDIAAQQLDLAGNVRGALLALQLAESRLARSDDAAFAPLRAALARDIERLKALPAFDPGALGQRIERLAVGVETLPLAYDERPAQAQAASESGQDGETWYGRLASEVWRELRRLIVVRRVESPEPPLLAPTQAYFLRENLRLRLLSARLALLTRDAKAYRDDLQAAQAWIKRYFDTRSSRSAEALAQLEQLASAPLQLELPSIEGSVNAVRALEARGGRTS